ncbi:MAG: hypothetical protein ACRDNI_06780 [Gaiellaceae bacterium]
MLWFTLWFAVILKLPALYLAYVIWWSVKDPPTEVAGNPGGSEGGGVLDHGSSGPRRPLAGRRSGPHGSPERRPRRTASVAARARAAR